MRQYILNYKVIDSHRSILLIGEVSELIFKVVLRIVGSAVLRVIFILELLGYIYVIISILP